MSNIQNTYYDALYFASASFNTKEEFAITPVQKDVLIKLIHYSTKDEVITWSTENIHKHTCIPIGSIDKAIQRLKQKGYITVTNKQISTRVVSRTILINWSLIQELDGKYKAWSNEMVIEEQPPIIDKVTEVKAIEVIEEPIIVKKDKPKSSRKKDELEKAYQTTLKYSKTNLSIPEFHILTKNYFADNLEFMAILADNIRNFNKETFNLFWDFIIEHKNFMNNEQRITTEV